MDLRFPLFLGNNWQHMPVCAQMISSWARKVLNMTKAHMSQGTLQGVVTSAVLVAGVFLVLILQAGEWAKALTPVRHYF